jgi:NAD(P)-dependent dehydrogenase (short-subunit alcohol dehydrogenase family)
VPDAGRLALVTGAGGGIGADICRRLAPRGLHVVCADIDASAAERIAKEIDGTPLPLDISDARAVAQAADDLRSFGAPLVALVNNAAIWRFGEFGSVPVADAEQVVRVNVMGPWHMTQSFAPLMPAGSAIVNISSTLAVMPGRGVGTYPSTKGALVSMTLQFALELGDRGIRVNCVGPGLIDTPPTHDAYGLSPYAELIPTLPVPRVGEPDDVAEVAEFLLLSAGYVTGQFVVVDGGWTLIGGP